MTDGPAARAASQSPPRRSIVRRLTLLTLGFGLVSTFVATGVHFRIEYGLERSELDARVHRTAEAYLPRLILAIHQQAVDETNSLLREIRELTGAASVVTHGEIAAAVGVGVKTNEQFVDFKYPLNFETHGRFTPLGTVTIQMSLAELDQRMQDQLLVILATQALKVLFVTAFFLFLVRTLVTQHLRTLSHYARRLKLDHLDQVLYLERGRRRYRDELDDVVGSINEMRVNLALGLDAKRKAQTELHRLNESLEAEVRERTSALRMALVRAEEAAAAKGRFLANMSHEMRTPLNGIIGLSQVLLDEPLNSDQRLWAQSILQSGEHLLDLVNDLLDVTRVESGEFELAQGCVDLPSIADGIRERYREAAIRKGLEFVVRCPEALPQLRGDPERITQVICNLVSNAIKFTERGSVEISFYLLNCDEDRARVRVSVSDTGIGVAPERRDSIFEAFTQEDASTTREYGGLGLGLALSKMLAELMGGRIGLMSRPGDGSTFFLELDRPLVREATFANAAESG
ncbi:MAG: sensor histidine kinase [Planctomycetota bacterium]